jgi:hypothetical protein
MHLADNGDTKWTAKYLATNEGVRGAVNTLLELAYLAPHESLTAGKVAVNITPAVSPWVVV